MIIYILFFFKQKTAYDMRISDWSSDVCASDLIDSAKVLDAIDPAKDVDGFHPVNVGRLSTGTGGLVPCTPMGCMILLQSVVPDLRGKRAVVIGKSNIVGKPVALLLLEQGCTVIVCNRHTVDLAD